MGAYAATCAYFIMISFVPFLMTILTIAARFSVDTSTLTEVILDIVPAGLREYLSTIITEVQLKSNVYLPVSLVILIWSASKVFHSLSNGLNVISKAGETKGWFFLRIRAMFYILIFVILIVISFAVSIFGPAAGSWVDQELPDLGALMRGLYSFRMLLGYFGLILVFLFIYKFLPNCRYTFRSQLPGALVVATVWMFFSYLISLYYSHNRNFSTIYGSLTGLILAMIWLYFCCYFLYFGAELNRIIYEDPDDNLIVNIIDTMKDAGIRREQRIAEELDEHSVWKPIRDLREAEVPSMQPSDIFIPWADELPVVLSETGQGSDENNDFYRLYRRRAQ